VAGVEPDPGPVTNPYQQGRPNQKPSGLACVSPYQTLPEPVLAMRISLVCLAWSGVRLPGLTNQPFWLGLHSLTLLPIITVRLGKYEQRTQLAGHTHDHKHLILHRNRGPRGLCVIPQASTPEVIPVGDPPTPRHNVPTRHAASTLIHSGLDPTTTSNGYDCPIMLCEAT